MFGKRLREARMKCGHTQPKMSGMLGVALRSYQCYETGTRHPNFEVLVKAADILNVSLDYLLCRDEFLSSGGAPADGCQASPQGHPKS